MITDFVNYVDLNTFKLQIPKSQALRYLCSSSAVNKFDWLAKKASDFIASNKSS